LEVAARLRQPQAAQWLMDSGATPEAIPLYDLGWADRLPALLSARPDIVNRRMIQWGHTPLHEAVNRNDPALAKLLLAAQPDLSLKDTQFHGTPLGWARHMGRTEMVALIEAHGPAQE
jgi:hypothetical protein